MTQRRSLMTRLQMMMSGLFASFIISGVAMAQPIDMTVERLLELCEAASVSAAATKGDELGWQRLSDAEIEDWRRNFVAYNAGSVDVVGWRRERAGNDESIAFWIAEGPNAHKACMHSTAKPGDLLEAMTAQLGTPDSLERHEAAELISVSWLRDGRRYAFDQVGTRALVSIGPDR